MKEFVLRSLRIMLGHPGIFAVFCFTVLAQVGWRMGSAFCYRVIFDSGLGQRDSAALIGALATLLGLLVVFSVAVMAQERAMSRLGTLTGKHLRHRLFEKQLAASPEFHRRFPPSDLVDRMGNDVGNVELAVVRSVPDVTLELIVIAAAVVLLFGIEWRLALVVFASIPAVMYASKPFRARASARVQSAGKANAQVLALTAEAATGYLPLVLFRAQPQFVQRFLKLIDELGNFSGQAHFNTGAAGRSAVVASGANNLLIIAVGSWLAFSGYMTPGLLVAFLAILISIGEAVNRVTAAVPMLARGAESMVRVDEVLQVPGEGGDPRETNELAAFRDEIRFEKIGFGYSGEAPILDDLSFVIPRGHAVALIGPSGSGKSTVISLLTRIYRPGSGRMLIDGEDISTATEDSLRALITAVPQTPILFTGTIRDNIAIARPSASADDIAAAASAAGLDAAIAELPAGYDTDVGAGGNRLSGGQRQRVAIARALLRRAPILIFDEATSALDAATETIVNRTTLSLRGDHTVIVVTHRLAGLADFDDILVFDRGRVVQRGRHAELVSAPGLYAELWASMQGVNTDFAAGTASISVERLARFSFLAGCTVETLTSLSTLFLLERQRENRYPFHQGDPGERFYVIARGAVEILLETEDGETRQLAVLRDGDFFGEIALVSEVPRTATVRTVTDCIFLTLHRTQFLALLEREPGLKERVEALIASRIAGQRARSPAPPPAAATIVEPAGK